MGGKSDWLDKANAYRAGKSFGNYGWVFEYAKFRLQFAYGHARYMDEKAMSLLKLVLGVSAAISAISGLVGLKFDAIGEIFVGLGILALIVSGIYCLRAFNPTERFYPLGEDVALRFMDSASSEGEALAGFSLATADSTEHENQVVSTKGYFILWGVRFVFAAISFFILAALWVVYLKIGPLFYHFL